MKGLNHSLLRAVCAFVLGLIFVKFPDEASNYLVITIGAVFMLPSLISILGYFAHGQKNRSRFPIEALGSLLFGLSMMIAPAFFADLLTFVLGFVLLMGGVQQLMSLMAARAWMPVAVGFYVVPVLILLAGITAVFYPKDARATTFIIIGVTAMVYACSELINWFVFTRRRPVVSSVEIEGADDSLQEITAEEVKPEE